MSREKKLEEELERAYVESENFSQTAPPITSFEGIQEYHEYMSGVWKKIAGIERKLRLIKTPTYSDLSRFGNVMSLESFVDNVKSGGFIDYDGYGHYVKNGMESDIEIYPSDVKNNAIRSDFDTIIWFNR